jgi:hypothetical protein
MGRLRLRLRLRLREKKSEVGGLRLKKGLEANGKVEVEAKMLVLLCCSCAVLRFRG